MLSKLLIVGGLLAVLAPLPAAAQLCGQRDAVITQLAQEFAEKPVAVGMAGNGAVVELLTSAAGSWTLLMNFPNGTACVMSTGESWEGGNRPETGRVA
jgi:hypothetical protein